MRGGETQGRRASLLVIITTAVLLVAPVVLPMAAGTQQPLPGEAAEPTPWAELASLTPPSAPMSMDLPDPSALERATTLTEALTASIPGLPAAELSPPGTLEEELAWWTTQLDRPHASAAALPTLDADTRSALAWLLAGARQAETIRAEATGSGLVLDAETLTLLQHPVVHDDELHRWVPHPRLTELTDEVDLDQLTLAAATLAEATDTALANLGGETPLGPNTASCDGEPTPPQVLADGLIALDLDGQDTVYTDTHLVSLDLGGCDTYLNEAGSAQGEARPVGLAIDLGASPDIYDAPPESYTQGSASRGIGLLLDAGGDDLYTGSGYANQGTGIVGGIGLLADLGGNDTYHVEGSGGGFGAQGLGTIGLGALIDLAGDDVYTYIFDPGEASFGSRVLSAQGTGSVSSIGVLADAGGDDVYTARTLGNIVTMVAQGSGFFSGTGVLLDTNGADVYTIEAQVASIDGSASGSVTGQGAADFDAVGLLLDGAGDDTYVLDVEGTGGVSAGVEAFGQGSAAGSLRDPATGLLLDLSGEDRYTTVARAFSEEPGNAFASARTAGTGYLEGTGLLVDAAGDDAYLQTLEASGGTVGYAQGAGIGPSLGILFDATGNDTYQAGPLAQGYGTGFAALDMRFPGGTGIFVDASGSDTFSGPGSTGAAFWVQGVDGVGIGVSGDNGAHNVEHFFDIFEFLPLP